jgi:GTP-binding protein
VHAFEVINGELAAFSESLTRKPMIVVATKLDATTDRTRLEALRDYCKRQGLEFHAISAAAGDGVKELVRSIADALDKIPKASLEHAADDESEPAAVEVDGSTQRATQQATQHAAEDRNS